MTLALSYLAAAIAFLVVLVLVATVWRGRLQGGWLVAALAIMVVWASYITFSVLARTFDPGNQAFLDILRGSLWVLLLWRLLHVTRHGQNFQGFWRNPWLWGFAVLVVILLGLNAAAGIPVLRAYYPLSFMAHLGPLLLALTVLVLLEQWYRSVPWDGRWSIKFFCLGTAIIFGSDFILYSEALLFGRLDPVLWEARGWLCFFMAPLMAVAIARSRRWRSEARVSRQAVFFGSSLFLAGIYLLVMALVGYYLRWFAPGIGNAAQVVFVVLALSFLVAVLSSGKYRSLLSVWLNKHFLSFKYDYRAEWMRANSRFASLDFGDQFHEQLLLGIAEPLDSLGGAIWVEDGQEFALRAQWSLRCDISLRAPEDASLLGFCARTGWIINLPEYRQDPDHYQGLQLDTRILEREDFWLLVPLRHQEHLYGLVALAQPRTERSVTWEDHDLLKALGGQVAALLALREVTESLASARQFEAYNQLSTFVVHDIKNVVAQLSLVVRNAEKHRHNPEFIDDALETLSSAVSRMNRMLSQLRQQASSGVRSWVPLSQILAQVESAQKGGRPQPRIQGPDTELALRVNQERLQSVLCHLVQNAQEATEETGEVVFRVFAKENHVCFEVADTGTGMEADFIRDGLFKPFVSTKGRAGMGIGVFEVRQFARDNGGSLDVTSTPGQGSTFRLWLPLDSPGENEQE